MKMYRQGDILFIQVDKIPDSTTEHKLNHRVVAEGETTGHAHQFLDERVQLVEIESTDILEARLGMLATKTLFIEVPDMTDKEFEQLVDESMRNAAPKGAVLSHEEHKSIILPPGKYLVRRQREYDETRDRWVSD